MHMEKSPTEALDGDSGPFGLHKARRVFGAGGLLRHARVLRFLGFRVLGV